MLLLVVTATVYSLSATWSGTHFVDAYGASLEAWRWATSGAPWLEGLDADLLFVTNREAPNWLFVEAGGHVVSSRTPGTVLAALPAYLIFAGPTWTIWPSTMVAVALSSLAVVMMYLALDRLAPRPVALAAAITFGFATPTWSVSADLIQTHTLTQFGIAGAAVAASRNAWWLTGAALAVAITGRPQTAVIAAILGIGIAIVQRSWIPAIRVGLPAAGGLALVMLINAYRYGTPTVSGGYFYASQNLTAVGGGEASEYLENWAGFLGSLDRGLLVWSPVIVLLLVPALRAARTAPPWVPILALAGLVYTAVQLKINHFSGGEAFYGYRHGLELATAAFPLLTVGWVGIRHRWVSHAVLGLLAWQAAVIATGSLVSGLWIPGSAVWTDSSVRLALTHAAPVFAVTLAISLCLALLGARHLGATRGDSGIESHDKPGEARRSEADVG